ncbi:hypothetical protein [Streptomyces sp. NBC_01373]|uniref:hypothetical protein n=1 Tax=Streptomyces sp. NBC_01373 TaxID=2903843 RepID=UPI002256004F|nr:hypothetical protein [Streptomyces sp. NBC_01373]MCX4705669.1 hypothetical protein [Streptomyces sp. NBC_01373]
MSIFSRSPKTSRAYPAAGTSVTGDAGRFRRHKTSGARRADRSGQEWEDRDRAQDRRGTWYRPAR